MRIPLAALFVLATLGVANADTPSGYDPAALFAPLSLPNPVNAYRSADGTPGPEAWQNRADYVLHATIDTEHKVLTGEETITYSNNSPSALESLWLQLDQNVYRRDARGRYSNPDRRRLAEFTEGYVLDAVETDAGGGMHAAPYTVSDTRLQIELARPLHERGRVHVHIRYHFTIPGEFGGRMAWGPSQHGDIYDLAQWYPRMAVFDDLRGWDTAPYMAQEFYLDYGDFDYSVTVPSDMIVAGSGELANPKDVLTPVQRQRLAQARTSDQTVMIRTPEEADAAQSASTLEELARRQGSTKTWRFVMHNTRDVAFSASRAFVWDAARINLPGGKTSLSMSLYPSEAQGLEAWGRSSEYLKHAVEEFSRRWYPYPWPAAINIAGPATGMEYPGIVFDGVPDRGKVLFWISAHEIGHTWFPMIVGFNERRDAWMDEGFNTFIDVYESDAFQHGIYGPKRDSEYAPHGGNPVDEILPILADPTAPPILTRADAISERYRHNVTYFKSALGLILLREQILGPERFDRAFRKFIRDWAFRHPTPSDFFRAMESEGGEDLSWWWREWYFNNWQLDLAVTGIDYTDNDPGKGANVTVANQDRMAMPATLDVALADGSHIRRALPVETWILRAATPVHIDTTQRVVSATIDPDHVLPDRDRANNTFARAAP